MSYDLWKLRSPEDEADMRRAAENWREPFYEYDADDDFDFPEDPEPEPESED